MRENISDKEMKWFILLLSLFIAVPAFAQEQSSESYTRYCQVSVYDGKVDLFFGEDIDFPGKDCYLSDEKATLIKFKSGIDAVNYLSRRGWRLEQYAAIPRVVNDYSSRSMYVWVLSKTVSSDKEVLEGIITANSWWVNSLLTTF